MPRPEIPEEVRRLISSHLPSVERLEILLLLCADLKRRWSVKDIEDEIRSSSDSIRRNVAALVEAKLAARDTGAPCLVRYAPADDGVGVAVAQLSTLYRSRRVSIIELVYGERRPEARSTTKAGSRRA